MSVYIDPLMKHGGSSTFRWTSSCHMYADTVEELDDFAVMIGLKTAWRQKSNSGLIHYDLNASRRRLAVLLGAIQHTRRQAVDTWARLKTAGTV